MATNRRARHDYHIEDIFEAGLVLTGTEVKSLRAGRASLVDGYASLSHGEVWLHGVHIPVYDPGTFNNHEPLRVRKLLLHRTEIARLAEETREGGRTVIPLQLYFSDGKAKVEIAVARGKKLHDKRQDIARRDADREMRRAIGRARKGMR